MYVVLVNEHFLHQLHKDSVSLQLNKGDGLKYEPVGVATLQPQELVASSRVKVHGRVSFSGVGELRESACVGSVDYWLKLKHPITQAIRKYQERTKAVVAQDDRPHLPSPSRSEDPSYNELVVTINNQLIGGDDHPSCYVMYKFYTFPDHDTHIIAHSSTPEFHNTHTFPLSVTSHLHTHLNTESLDVYMFNDDSTKDGYLGLAHVPLAQLYPKASPLQGPSHCTMGVYFSYRMYVNVPLALNGIYI